MTPRSPRPTTKQTDRRCAPHEGVRSGASDRLGAHVSVAGGMAQAPARAAAIGAGAFQVFTKNQTQWIAKPLAEQTIGDWFAELQRHGYDTDRVCSHDSYLINLASPGGENLARSLTTFVDEIERCARLKIGYLVFHPGAHLGSGEATGIAAIAANLDRCLETAGSGSVRHTEDVCVCLENTAGQGSNLGYRFEHLRDIIGQSRYPDRLGVCLDTCHLFAAGYRFHTPRQVRATLRALDEVVGLQRVRVLHLNDSKRAFASRVDRHARIGQGEIGAEPFRTLLRYRKLRDTLKILEIPGGDDAYAEDLALLRKLAR